LQSGTTAFSYSFVTTHEGGGLVSTVGRQETGRTGVRAWIGRRWLILTVLLIIAIIAVAIVFASSGGGSVGGGGGY
jgi:hypothetical protein